MEESTEACAQRLGLAMRHARIARKMSQEDVAHRAGLTASYYGQVERGERNITLGTLLHIGAALGAQPSGLLAEAGH